MCIYFLAIFNHKKSTIGINACALTLNKSPILTILTIFNHEKAP